METQAIKEFLNYGVPLFLLVALVAWLAKFVVQPFLGPTGVIARFFTAVSEQADRQNTIAERHQELTQELAKMCDKHHGSADAFYKRTDITMQELLEIDRHVIAAMQCHFDSDAARSELSQADAIIRRHLDRPGQ